MFDDVLVITDMDGTLLNHHDYQVTAALPMLKKLDAAGIPVIFNTSKTFVEVKDWVSLLENKHPFIVENGSAIYIPNNYFSENFQQKHFADARHISGFTILLAGMEIDSIKDFLKSQPVDAIDFTECSLQQAMDITGLTQQQAEAARTRQFSVPLMFSNENKQRNFSEQAKKAGFGILKGGRFLHVLGLCDKGSSMQILKNLFQQYFNKSYGLIVLGDSPNDLAMLQQADIPVIVNSPSCAAIELDHPALIATRSEAPEGWVEGVELALDKIESQNIKIKQEKNHGG